MMHMLAAVLLLSLVFVTATVYPQRASAAKQAVLAPGLNLTWSVTNQTYAFTVSANISAWIALGFSVSLATEWLTVSGIQVTIFITIFVRSTCILCRSSLYYLFTELVLFKQ